MAISWGAFETSGGNGIRVGIEVDWDTPTNGSSTVDATVKIYTDNQFSYNDSQTLTYGGHISGSTNFTNNDGDTAVLRATKTYTYTYGSSSYGSSPGTRTFSAALSGAFNGVTPSHSVTVNIPARPYAAPLAPTSASVSRISDTSTPVSWVNNSTAGRPWSNVHLRASVNGGAYFYVTTSISGAASSYTVGTAANQKLRFSVAAVGPAGSSAWAETGFIWTAPATPTISTTLTNITGPPAGKRISWTNNVAYTEYQTVVVAYKDGVDQGAIATLAAGVTSFDHTTAHATKPYTVANKWKYYTYAQTTSGTLLYSGGSSWTEETPGTTTPPLAPTGLIPSGYSIDPTLAQPLTWTFNPGQIGDTQTQYQLRHRLVGSGTWTTVGPTVSGTASYTLPANTYLDGQSAEWQVSTKGADPTFSPWSASGTFTLTVTPLEPESVKLPILMDVGTGDLEASSTAFEVRDLATRAQMLQGGGIKTVLSDMSITWSNIFRVIAKGRSEDTQKLGHMSIMNPYGWVVTNKILQSNKATLTITTGTSHNKMRVGDLIVVAGVGAPFDGNFTVLESTTNSVSYTKVNANVASAASGGTVHHIIHGHGGATNSYPAGARIFPAAYEALYYELPIGWGTGGEARRNGVVAVTNKVLTSNVATLTVVKPHYFAVNEFVIISGVGAPFDGQYMTTGVTDTTISYAKVNANIASTAVSGGLAAPGGYDTMFGNFHLVGYTEDFVVPSNWVLIAFRNEDAPRQIEWGDGDKDTGWVAPASWGTGWTNYSDTNFNANSEIFRRLNGVVYCQGLIARVSGTATQALYAPVGMRPRGSNPPIKLYEVYATAALGRMDVYSDGLFNFAAGTATYVSLNNISYPAAI